MVFGCGLQILTNRQEIDVGGTHIFHHLNNSLAVFTQADHNTRLGEYPRVDFFYALQQPQRMEIPRSRSDLWIKPGYRFKVVIEYIRTRLNNLFQRLWRTSDEIGCKNFDCGVRATMPYGANGLRKVLGATVFNVVAVN